MNPLSTCRWNFTVAHVFLSLVEGELGEEEKDVSCQVEDFSNWTIHTDASQDLLYVTNRSVHTRTKGFVWKSGVKKVIGLR